MDFITREELILLMTFRRSGLWPWQSHEDLLSGGTQ
jgi:hypothetical protein